MTEESAFRGIAKARIKTAEAAASIAGRFEDRDRQFRTAGGRTSAAGYLSALGLLSGSFLPPVRRRPLLKWTARLLALPGTAAGYAGDVVSSYGRAYGLTAKALRNKELSRDERRMLRLYNPSGSIPLKALEELSESKRKRKLKRLLGDVYGPARAALN